MGGKKEVLVERLKEALKNKVPLIENHTNNKRKLGVRSYAPHGTSLHFCAAGEDYCLAPFLAKGSLQHTCSECKEKIHTHCIGYQEDMHMKCAKCCDGQYDKNVIAVAKEPSWWTQYKNGSKRAKEPGSIFLTSEISSSSIFLCSLTNLLPSLLFL